MPASTSLLMPHDPEPELAQALGLVAARHAYLDRMLIMVMRSLTGTTVPEAVKAMKRTGSAELRDRIRKLARRVLDDGAERVRLEAMLSDCARVTRLRNAYLHSVAGKYLDGGAVLVDGEDITEMPKPDSLRLLADEIGVLADALRDARVPGSADPWLGTAIARAGRLDWPVDSRAPPVAGTPR